MNEMKLKNINFFYIELLNGYDYTLNKNTCFMQMKQFTKRKKILLDLNASLQPKLLPLIIEIAKPALLKKKMGN